MSIEKYVEEKSEIVILRQKFEELLKYGNSNHNWDTLLELRQFQEDILYASALWEELERKGADGSIDGLASIKSEMEAVERKFDNLQKIAKDIKSVSIFDNGFGLGRDLQVRRVMDNLQYENFRNINEEVLGRLKYFLDKLEKFKTEYNDWMNYRESLFEDFVKRLKNDNKNKLQNKAGMFTSFPSSPSQINKQTTGDGGWRGRKH